MKIGVISDTHDQAQMIEQAVEHFNQAKVDLVIHCGDWVAPFILYFFRELKAPMRGVFGNNDGDKFRHLAYRDKLGLNIEYEDRFLELEFGGRKIAVFHGDYSGLIDALVTCGKYDAVFHGHTHKKVNETHGKTLSLNPGSLMKVSSATVKGASIAIYDAKTNAGAHIVL